MSIEIVNGNVCVIYQFAGFGDTDYSCWLPKGEPITNVNTNPKGVYSNQYGVFLKNNGDRVHPDRIIPIIINSDGKILPAPKGYDSLTTFAVKVDL